MNILVTGVTGTIGSSVVQAINANRVNCDHVHLLPRSRLDLLHSREFDFTSLQPLPTLAFLCAGVTGFKECEGEPNTWRVNVDGTLDVALRLIRYGCFIVYPSTQAVEWLGSAYARQRAQVEAVLLAKQYAAIVRCGRVTNENKLGCAAELYKRGVQREPGVFRWT